MDKFLQPNWESLGVALIVVALVAAAGLSAFLLSRPDGVAQVAAPSTVGVGKGDVVRTIADSALSDYMVALPLALTVAEA